MSRQAQASESRISIALENDFKELPEYEIIAFESALTAVGSGVTQALDSLDYRGGSNAAVLSLVASLMTAGETLFWQSLGGVSLADLSYVELDIKPAANVSANNLRFVLGGSSALGSVLESLALGALVGGEWNTVRASFSNPAGLTSAVSAGVKIDSPFNGQIRFDRARAIRGMVNVPFTSEDVSLKRNLISSKTLRSNRNPVMPVRGNKDVGGPLSIELSAYIQRLLYCLFGSVATSPGGGAYTHTFKIGDLPSFTYEKGFTDLDTYFLYSGCKISQLKLTVPQEGFITGAFDVLGAKRAINTVPFDDAFDDDGFVPFDAFSGQIKVDGSVVAVVTAVDLTINNNLDGSSYTIDRSNPGERRYLPARKVAATGTLTALFEDISLLTLASNNTETSLELDFMNGTGLGTAGNEKLTINLDEMKFSEKDPGIPGDEGIKVVLDFEAYYQDDADASAAYATLIIPVARI
jgi:hypothetical protein